MELSGQQGVEGLVCQGVVVATAFAVSSAIKRYLSAKDTINGVYE